MGTLTILASPNIMRAPRIFVYIVFTGLYW